VVRIDKIWISIYLNKRVVMRAKKATPKGVFFISKADLKSFSALSG